MRSITILATLAVALAALFLLYQLFIVPAQAPNTARVAESSSTDLKDKAAVDAATKEVAEASSEQSAAGDNRVAVNEDSTASSTTTSAATAEAGNSNDLAGSSSGLFAYEIGREPLSDESLLALVEQLKKDPALLADVMNELRSETDPERLKRLVLILGETGTNEVLPFAEELIYSGNSDTRAVGLDLLSRIAPNNPEALTIAGNILGGETEPDVLVATMNVLAQPRSANADTRDSLVSQITPLANHETAAVRRHSISILNRLTNDQSLSPILYGALSDNDASVREAAVYAYSSYPYQTPEAVQRLMDIVEDESEEKGVRRGAILAVRNMSPDEQTTARLDAATKQLRRRRTQ